MALIQEMERHGNWLFRYRGQIPVVLFLMAIPAVLATGNSSRPEWILFLALVLSLSGAVIRAYTIGTTPGGTSGRNTQQQVAESLNTSGIYSVVRHPLYLGNYLMWIGIVVYTGNLSFVALVTLMYWLYYERIMIAEEAFLHNKFGNAYREWAISTPAFFPALNGFRPPSVPFSLCSVFRREYSGWLAVVFGWSYVDFLKGVASGDSLSVAMVTGCWSNWKIPLLSVLALTLVLRTLKHKTRILSEEGRS